MEALGVGPVTEWVAEEDAWWVLPSPPPGALGERGVFWRAGDDVRQDDGPGATDGVSPPLAPSQGCKQETTSAETTRRRHG